MTMTEYLNQRDPRKGLTVYLEKEDYRVLFSFPKYDTSENKRFLHLIQIHEFPEYKYILDGDSGFLFATDSDGNAKAVSVFYIKSLSKIKEYSPFELTNMLSEIGEVEELGNFTEEGEQIFYCKIKRDPKIEDFHALKILQVIRARNLERYKFVKEIVMNETYINIKLRE
jgi:hypothetical protein